MDLSVVGVDLVAIGGVGVAKKRYRRGRQGIKNKGF
jgi:hypothetical protein